MTDQRFRPKEHLRRLADFQRVYDRRCSAANAWVIAYAAPNGLEWNRVGFSVSKRLGNAVRRNFLKRRLREAYRRCKRNMTQGFDLVLIPRISELPSVLHMIEEFPLIVLKAITRSSQKAP